MAAASWRDNVFVERLWRSVKYEEVYLRAYDSVAEARARSVGIWPSTTASGRIRAWRLARPTKPTSVHRRSAQLRKFAASIQKVIERAT